MFCPGEVRRQELSGSVECGGRVVEDRVVRLEDVGYPGADVEGDLDVSGGGLPCEADGVVEEDLVSSGLDDEGRQVGQVGEYGADKPGGGIFPGRVVGDPGWRFFPAEQRVGVTLVSMVVPARVRSAYGDMTKAAAGRGHT